MKSPIHVLENHVLLFVYGSLKSGFELHSYLQQQEFCGVAMTSAMYRLFNCGEYPALVFDNASGRSIHGEVYQVTAECLTQIDQVEGVDEGLYAREPIQLASPDWLLPCRVYAYFYLQSTVSLPDCGSSWQ